MAIALFGATAPEGVVWYTGQFYALIYMTTVLKLNYEVGGGAPPLVPDQP
jgi:hypothetical protein